MDCACSLHYFFFSRSMGSLFFGVSIVSSGQGREESSAVVFLSPLFTGNCILSGMFEVTLCLGSVQRCVAASLWTIHIVLARHPVPFCHSAEKYLAAIGLEAGLSPCQIHVLPIKTCVAKPRVAVSEISPRAFRRTARDG